MPKIVDEGFILHKRPFGEGKVILSVLTPHHGRVCGVLRLSKKDPLDIATFGKMTWNSRLSDQLGSMSFEGGRSLLPHVYGNYRGMLLVQSLCMILHTSLPERQNYEKIYSNILSFSEDLSFKAYVKFELSLLGHLGFGLDLRKCVVTGQTHDLAYISPKSGRTVCKDAGLPYHDKLFPLPSVWMEKDMLGDNDSFHNDCAHNRLNNLMIHQREDDYTIALRILGYFLQKHVMMKLPSSRMELQKI